MINSYPSLTTSPIDDGSWAISRDQVDFFNIRGYSLPLSNEEFNFIKNRNLVNSSDRYMVDLQEDLIYFHLDKILGIPLPLYDVQVQSYDRFGVWDPGFCVSRGYKKSNYSHIAHKNIPGIIFTTGSQANHYAIETIKALTRNTLIISSQDSHKSITDQRKTSTQSIYSSQDFFKIVQSLVHNKQIGGVVATFGTTNFGSNDDRIMDYKVLKYCKEHNILIHLDMAYGGYYLTSQQKARLNANSSHIHSIMIDPHKMICDSGCSLLLYPNGKPKIDQYQNTYFTGLGVEAGTTVGPLASYQAQLFLNRYGLPGLNLIKQECLKIAKQIGEVFEEAGYELYTPSHLIQYPNICVNIGNKKLSEYLHGYFDRHYCGIAKIQTDTEYGIRIFVSPTADFFNLDARCKLIELIYKNPRETFTSFED